MHDVLVGIEGFTCIVYSPGIFPVVVKLVGNACFRAIMSLTSAVVRWSCEGGMICALWSWKGAVGCLWSWKGPSKWSCEGVIGDRWSRKSCVIMGFALQVLLLCGFWGISSMCGLKVTVFGTCDGVCWKIYWCFIGDGKFHCSKSQWCGIR